MKKFLKIKKDYILINILKYSLVVIFVLMLSSQLVIAVEPGATTGGTTTIDNPLGENGPQTIPDFIARIINIVLQVGGPIITLALIYTGFLFVAAQGNPEKLTKAKKALIYTLIGAALLLGALIIAEAIKTTVDSIGAGT